eukprot:1094397-Pleurochrysis_carterae.AAC.1
MIARSLTLTPLPPDLSRVRGASLATHKPFAGRVAASPSRPPLSSQPALALPSFVVLRPWGWRVGVKNCCAGASDHIVRGAGKGGACNGPLSALAWICNGREN